MGLLHVFASLFPSQTELIKEGVTRRLPHCSVEHSFTQVDYLINLFGFMGLVTT